MIVTTTETELLGTTKFHKLHILTNDIHLSFETMFTDTLMATQVKRISVKNF